MRFLVVAVLSLASVNAWASTDYSACDAKELLCVNPTSCTQFYLCQRTTHAQLTMLIFKALDESEYDMFETCQNKRNDLEADIFGHMTTIECVDTENGPKFGG